MKICWDNLEKLTYIGNGVWKRLIKNNYYIYYIERANCKNCGNPYLASKYSRRTYSDFCDKSCAASGKNNPQFGKKRSKQICNKISNSVKGHKNPNFGKKNPEHRELMSGKGNPMFGKTHTCKTRDIISEKAVVRLSVPENNPNWRGGLSYYSSYCRTWKDKEFRDYIKERDKEKFCWNPNCMYKGSKQNLHHIDYNKKNCDPKNIITLCNSCNAKANFNRNNWKLFYKSIMKSRDIEI